MIHRSRPARRTPGRHKVAPCGCNPYAGIICHGCQDAYRASETCWHCHDGVPVGMRDGKPICAKCCDTIAESTPNLSVAS